MTIGSEITSMCSQLARNFNSLATFTPSTGSAVSLRVDFDKTVQFQPEGLTSQAWPQAITIEALLADLPHEPNRTETFAISGTTYTVQAVIENDGYFVKVHVK